MSLLAIMMAGRRSGSVAAPVASGGLADQTYTQNSGNQTVDASGDFTGAVSGTWSVTGTGATINSSGVVTITTAALRTASTVTITYTNSGGSDSSAFDVTVEAAAAGMTLVGSGTERVPSGSGTTAVSLPTMAENDLVVVAMACDNDLGATARAVGYDTIIIGGVSFPGMQTLYKRQGSTPDTDFDVTQLSTRNIAVVWQVWRGVDTTTALDATPLEDGSGDPLAITTVTDGALVFAVTGIDDDNPTVTAAPSGYTNLSWEHAEDTAGTGSDGAGIMMASKVVATAGSEDPGSFTHDGDDTERSVTFALRPAA